VLLALSQPLKPDQVLSLSIAAITDCPGNTIAAGTPVPVGLPVDTAARNIVINEVLFNPKPSGTDYVELFNKGKLVVDAHDLTIARRNAQGILTNMVPCSPGPFLIFPGDFYVLSENPDIVSGQYLVRHPESLSPAVNLPSMPDDEGTIVVLDRQGAVADELHYSSSWHFPLLDDVTGVSLERVNPAAPTQSPSNWHSAAADIGYGTPTASNSQHRDTDSAVGTWKATPEVFSPDLDGYDDLLTLSYKFPGPGWSTSVTIYDREGRPIRWLCRNMLCGNEGQLRWDGLDEAQKHPGWGAYLVVAESIALDGRRSVWRKRISIAGSRR
jgi:Lamin Tail Domain